MQDPERIPKTLKTIEEVWRQHPDWRLGQLLVNAMGLWPYTSAAYTLQRLLYGEDEQLVEDLQALEKHIGAAP